MNEIAVELIRPLCTLLTPQCPKLVTMATGGPMERQRLGRAGVSWSKFSFGIPFAIARIKTQVQTIPLNNNTEALPS